MISLGFRPDSQTGNILLRILLNHQRKQREHWKLSNSLNDFGVKNNKFDLSQPTHHTHHIRGFFNAYFEQKNLLRTDCHFPDLASFQIMIKEYFLMGDYHSTFVYGKRLFAYQAARKAFNIEPLLDIPEST
eukprot:Pgem_evm1s17913